MFGTQGLPILKITEPEPELLMGCLLCSFIQEGSSGISEVGGCGDWIHGV